MNIRKITNTKIPSKIIRENPCELPQQEGESKIYQYGLIPDAPINVLTICGVDCHKFTMSAEYGSLRARGEKQQACFQQTKQYILLSQNQLSFLISESKKRTLEYFTRTGEYVKAPYSSYIYFKEEKKESLEAKPITIADFYAEETKNDSNGKGGNKEKNTK